MLTNGTLLESVTGIMYNHNHINCISVCMSDSISPWTVYFVMITADCAFSLLGTNQMNEYIDMS